MKITVTKEDILEAWRIRCYEPELPVTTNCPVALALRRNGITFDGVTPDFLVCESGQYNFPRAVGSFVGSFDGHVAGEMMGIYRPKTRLGLWLVYRFRRPSVGPFSFEFDPPKETA